MYGRAVRAAWQVVSRRPAFGLRVCPRVARSGLARTRQGFVPSSRRQTTPPRPACQRSSTGSMVVALRATVPRPNDDETQFSPTVQESRLGTRLRARSGPMRRANVPESEGPRHGQFRKQAGGVEAQPAENRINNDGPARMQARSREAPFAVRSIRPSSGTA